MASPKSTTRPRRTPLKPVRPLGQDDPEDTPSKIRLRGAVESASLRRRQEEELVRADLQNGLDLHEQLVEDRARKSKQAKADAELRRQLFTVQKVHKEATRREEADRLQEARALEADERRARQEWIESQKKAREEEKKEERKMRAETLSHEKEVKAAEKARERELLTRDYQATLVERARREEEKKAVKREEMAERKAAIIEAREKRARDRALAAAALRAEVERQREEARASEEEKRKAAEERRQLLRDRASQYREDKQLLKTSAYTR